MILACAGLCILLIWAGAHYPDILATPGLATYLPQDANQETQHLHPFFEFLKLVVASLLGIVITSVHRFYHRDKSRSFEQAEILLCVAGALMMIIIGNSLARAFGVFGAASLVRFRTPVEDPEDTTMLFLLLGIGMACGLGSFRVAGLAAIFLCFCLFMLNHLGEHSPRLMLLDLKADGPEFPRAYVETVLAAQGVTFEPREITRGKDASIRYYVELAPATVLKTLTDQLMAASTPRIKSVAWESLKKRDG
jgi:hypothetical protein